MSEDGIILCFSSNPIEYQYEDDYYQDPLYEDEAEPEKKASFAEES
jgi:hypothetical protein